MFSGADFKPAPQTHLCTTTPGGIITTLALCLHMLAPATP
jgi:hypothetical protein